MNDEDIKNLVLYVFVRTDLPSMNPGKAQAHSGHAANAFINQAVIKPMRSGVTDIWEPVQAWMAMTPFGFGTQINLKAPWPEVVNLVEEIDAEGARSFSKVALAEIIIDPTYPYIVDKEVVELIDPNLHTVPPIQLEDGRYVCHRKCETAAYVFGNKRDLEPYVGKYPLHP